MGCQLEDRRAMSTAPVQPASSYNTFEGVSITADTVTPVANGNLVQATVDNSGQPTLPFNIISLQDRLRPQIRRPFNWPLEFGAEPATPTGQALARIRAAGDIARSGIVGAGQELLQQAASLNLEGTAQLLGIKTNQDKAASDVIAYATNQPADRTLSSRQDLQRVYLALQKHRLASPRGIGQFLGSTGLIVKGLLGFAEPDPMSVRIETLKRAHEIKLALGKVAAGQPLSIQLKADRMVARKLNHRKPGSLAYAAKGIAGRIEVNSQEALHTGTHFALYGLAKTKRGLVSE